MKRNISKQVSKLSVFLVLFLALTLVFTLYQTSINAYVNDVATELNLTEDGEEILGYIPITAFANVQELDKEYQMIDAWEEDSWTVGGDTTSTSATMNITNDSYLRAAHGSVIKFYAVFNLVKRTGGDAGYGQWAISIGGVTASVKTSTVQNNVTSSGQTLPGGYNQFAGTITCFSKGVAGKVTRAEKMRVKITTSDTGAPSISSTNATSINSAEWQTSPTVTISDDGAGLNTISYTYTNLSGSSSKVSPFNASGTSRETTQTLTLDSEGKYEITATDNVGNSNTKTIWKYNSTITATVNHAQYGTANVGDTNSTSISGKYASESYALYAKPNDGYYFTGWTCTTGGLDDLDVGSYNSSYKQWETSSKIPDSPGSNEYVWQAQFKDMAPILKNGETDVEEGVRSFTYAYNGQPIKLMVGTVPKGYSASLSFSNSKTNEALSVAPTYAGEYTATLNLTYSSKPIGTITFTITITPIDVYAYPNFKDGNSKIYDGTNVITQTNATDWELGDESSSNPIITGDVLEFTTTYTTDGGFHFNNKTVGSNLPITIEDTVSESVTISSKKAGEDPATLEAIAGSYVFHLSTQNKPTGTIKPKRITISSAGYGQCYNGEATIDNLDGFYVGGEPLPNGTFGKVYDGSDNAFLKGIIISGYIAGDNVGFGFDTVGTPNTTFKTENGITYISAEIDATFPDISAKSGYTVTSVDLYFGGTDKGNYYIEVDGTEYGDANTPYANQPFNITQEGCAIAQKDVTIIISSVTKKTYDGSAEAIVAYSWDGNPLQKQMGEDGNLYEDNLYIDGADAKALYCILNDAETDYIEDASANYNTKTGKNIGTKLKHIKATGLAIKAGDKTDGKPETDVNNYRLTSTTAIKDSASFNADNYANSSFLAIDTREVTVTLQAEGKTYDGNAVCYNYTLTAKNTLEGDKITASAESVTYNTPNASTGDVTATATGITISSTVNNASDNYHLTSATAQHSGLTIAKKDIKDVVLGTIADVYYSGAQYTPTPSVTDGTLLEADGTTKYEKTLSVGKVNSNGVTEGDFNYEYSGNRINAGTFTIIVNGINNYTGSAETSATILKANVKISGGVKNISIIYGQMVTLDDIVVVGEKEGSDGPTRFIVNEQFPDVAVQGSWAFVGFDINALPTVANSGEKTVKFTPTLTNNYNLPSENKLHLTVKQRKIIITATPQSFTFGEEIVFLNKDTSDHKVMTYQAKDTVKHEGLVNESDSFGTLNCVVSNMVYRLSDEGATDGKVRCMAGQYAITNTDANGNITIKNDNYYIIFEPATFTINKHTLTLSAVYASKTYGEADPALEYVINVGEDGAVDENLIDGYPVREEGEDVGLYLINGGTILSSEFNTTNYIITGWTTAKLQIIRRQISVTPKNASSYYGQTIAVNQTAFTFAKVEGNDLSGLALIDFEDVNNNRKWDEGEAFTDQGKNGNWDKSLLNIILTNVGGNQEINLNLLAVGTYDLVITAGAEDVNKNYIIVPSDGKYVVHKRPITVTPLPNQGKTYNAVSIANNDNAIAYTTAPQTGYEFLGAGEVGYGLSGALTHDDSSPDIGFYDILQGTLSNENNPNYDILFVSGVKYEIRKLSITVNVPKVYKISVGDAIPADDTFEFNYTPSVLNVNNQQIALTLRGKLTVDVSNGIPEDVGTYNLVADAEMLSDANKNFTVVVNGTGKFVIEAKTAVITPELTQRTFGEALAFGSGENQINIPFSIKDKKGNDLSGLLVGDDAEFSGSLSITLQGILDKEENESYADYMVRVNEYLTDANNKALPAGKYAINFGSFKAIEHDGKANYEIEPLKDFFFEVTKKAIMVSVPDTKADGTPNLTKTYDKQGNDSIEFTILSSAVAGYPFSDESAISRESGFIVKPEGYAVNIGNLNSLDAHENYLFELDKDYVYVIEQRFITVTPVIPDGKTQISSIYGYEDAPINYTTYLSEDSTKPGLIEGDMLGGSLAREAGSEVKAEGYQILIGTLNRDSDIAGYNANYNVSLDTTTDIRYYVTRRDVRVQAVSVTGKNAQVFGDAEKTLNVTYTPGDLVIGQSALNGTPVREEGVVPGNYAIKQGSMNNDSNPNYNVIFTEGTYTIAPRPLTISATPNQQKGYTLEDPEFTYEISGLVEGYDIGLTVTREAGETPGEKKYGIVFILENNDVCINNSYYTFTGFSIQAGKYDGKRFFIDKKNAFSIKRGTVEVAFNDDTTLVDGAYTLSLVYNGEEQFVDSYLKVGGDEVFTDANGNGVWDEGEELIDVNKNGVWDAGVNVRYTVNGKTGRTFKNVGSYTVSIIAATNDMFVGGTFIVNVTVTPKDLGTVNPADYLNASDLTKVYGDLDPSDYKFTMNALGEDVIEATMVREEGENVGSYDLVSISIDNANYKLSFAEGTNEDVFTITAREIVVNPTPKAIKYGVEMASWTEIVTDAKGNEVEITYARTDASNNNANTYDIASYEINSLNHFVTIASDDLVGKFVITKVQAVVTANAKTKTFDGQPINLTDLTFDHSGMVNGEIPVGSLTIVADGELDLINVGTYTIEAIGFDNASNPNYDMTFVGATYVVNKASVTVSPDPATVGPYQYGETIAPFGYVITNGTVYPGYELVGELGELTSTAVNEAGHLVPQGTLTNANNPNYSIEYFNNDEAYRCVINKRYIKIKVESATQVYGDPMPELVYHFQDGTSLVGEDKLNGTLSATGEDVGTYEIIMSEEFQNDNPNYEVDLDNSEAIFTITARPITITPDAKTVVYGENSVALSYVATNLANETIYKNASLTGELLCVIGSNVGKYEILQGSLANDNYEITFVTGVYYEITPRDITVTINDAESEYGQEDAELTYDITKGYLIGNDELLVTLVRESGAAMGFYEISGTSANGNYNVTFINGTYTIKKYKAVITVEEQFINFVEDGTPRTISAVCSSGAEITYTIDFETVHNFFKTAGKYVVELNAPETENYYAPDAVTVYITINRPFVQSEANGIDVKLEAENGFDPTLHVEMSKLPADYADIQAELKSNQKIVRAFSLTTSSDQTSSEMVPGKTTITIKVPSSLQEEKAVQVIVQENGVYNQIEVDVIDGYVTLEVDSISNFAFIMEENNNYFLLIIIGAAALIVLGSVMVFLFRKRA